MMFGWDRQSLDTNSEYKESNLSDQHFFSPTMEIRGPNYFPTIDPACEMLGMTRRVIMQKMGTEAFRQGIHEDFWVILKRIQIEQGKYKQFDVAFMTDCRFLNEINFCREYNGINILLQRFADDSLNHQITHLSSSHASEAEFFQFKDWDAIVNNVVTTERTQQQNVSEFRHNLITCLPWEHKLI